MNPQHSDPPHSAPTHADLPYSDPPASAAATPLAEILIRRIRATGPVSVADYMAECLLHPQHGYYATRDPFGQAGDFTTAPEISQMFGELLGLALAQSWLDQGAPTPFILAEPGPGRGTLMADILRATARVPGFHAGARLHLIEASATLRKVQAKTLTPFTATSTATSTGTGTSTGTATSTGTGTGTCAAPVWHDTIDTLPDAPLFLVANEFFDALPIRQFIRAGGGTGQKGPDNTPHGDTTSKPENAASGQWHERVIGLAPDTQAPDTPAPDTPASDTPAPDPQAARPATTAPTTLCFGLTPPAPRPFLTHRLHNTRPGDLVEICPALPGIVNAMADRIARHGGVALIVDYGDEVSLGDTLQALRNHAPDDPLAHPGLADLTAHVDFDAIRRAATDAPTPGRAATPPPPAAGALPPYATAGATAPPPAIAVTPLTPQGVLLERLGITARARALARPLTGAALDSHVRAHRRLTHPAEMGNLFKAIALYPRTAPQPPGFAP